MLTLPASLVALSFPVTRIYLGKLVIGFNILSTTPGHTWGWTNTVFSQCTFKTLLDLKLYENQIYRLSPNTYTTWEISLQTWSSLLWMESKPPFPAYMHFSFQCAPFFFCLPISITKLDIYDCISHNVLMNSGPSLLYSEATSWL